jgi:hypothetical protein
MDDYGPAMTIRGIAIGVVLSAALPLASLALAGCGGGEPATKPAPSVSVSPTAPPGFTAPEPERPSGEADTTQSAVAYGRYFAEVVQYAVRTRSSRPVAAETFDQARCASCRQLSTFVGELVTGGYWEVGDDLDLSALRATRVASGVRVAGSFVYPQASYVEVDGTRKGQVSAKNYRYTADLTWDRTKGRWRVLDYVFKQLGTAN